MVQKFICTMVKSQAARAYSIWSFSIPKILQLVLLESLKVGICVFFNLSLTTVNIGSEQRDYQKYVLHYLFFCHKARDENMIKKIQIILVSIEVLTFPILMFIPRLLLSATSSQKYME